MSNNWMTVEQIKEDRDKLKFPKDILEEGCEFVMCMVSDYYKYKPDYKAAVIVSYEDGVYKCSRGHSWNHVYAIDIFGEPLTVYAYNKMRSAV